MERYKSIGLIEQGRFSEVHKCQDVKTGAFVAMKWIPFRDKRGGLPYEVLREISVLRELNHINVVRLLDVVDEKDRFGLVLEDMGDDLAQFIKDHPNTTMFPSERKSFLFQILQGVAYCHSQKVMHRHLKPQSVHLNTMKQTVKLADFGCARTFDVPLPYYSIGAESYGRRPPEVLVGIGYSNAADIWAVGCIFAEMVTSKPLFDGKSEAEVMIQIFRLLGLPGDIDWLGHFKDLKVLGYSGEIPSETLEDLAESFPGLEREGLDLLSKMLCIDHEKRITAVDALKHPYFNDVEVNHLVSV